MSEIKAIIFDVDGTLVSVGKNYSFIYELHEIYRKLLERITGRDFSHLTSMQIYDTIRLPYKESVRILNKWGIKNPREFWNQLEKEDYMTRKDMIGESIVPYPDAMELLRILKENGNPIKCGILSNAPESIAKAELEGAGLLNCFDYLCCFNYNSSKSKPSGWGINKMLSEWGICKENTWIFGDAEQDVEAGKDAGVQTGQVLRENHPTLKTVEPDVEGNDLLELWRKANEMQVR
ncbi:MAG: HAD family hydrolase [Candidatus Aenigmarchaeota archaeon]|nr:HAD family hydrolase [Candidatus Aenigmarchaeota archaeon]